jgi:rod shape-determining protein MreC
VQYAVDKPIKMVRWLSESFTQRQDLMQQNAHLKAQVLLLKARLYKTQILQKENQQLRALLKSQPQGDARVHVAQLLATNNNPYVQQVLLNQGQQQQVYQGQPVLDAHGVFGQVMAVGRHTSQVMLITNRHSSVPVEDARSHERGILVGQGNGHTLGLKYITATMDVKQGDALVTSGLGQRYPAGYPIGKITAIEKNNGAEFLTVAVKPSAHLHRSRLVLLIGLKNKTPANPVISASKE